MSREDERDAAAERTRARREAAKRLHPDRGGDPAEFDRAMRSFETPPPESVPASEPAYGPESAGRPIVHGHTTRAARVTKALRTTSKTVVADVRRRLPRSFPGSRRYGRL